MSSTSTCHIKVITDISKSTAYLPALCGVSDYGQLYYISFNSAEQQDVERMKIRAEMGKDGDTTLCSKCCAAFLANYNSDSKVMEA